jgi:NAD(P)-dependent dehydrogenase (short-subunit alcohol dehydrogenase family)
MDAERRSAVVFGARNLGRAIIELLVSEGWAVTGVARSQSTLEGVRAAGALALEGDVTDPARVTDALEEGAAALELRPQGIQVALLIVDAGIQPRDGSTRRGVAPEALAESWTP